MVNIVVNQNVMAEMTTNNGSNVLHLSKKRPILLIFLRHFGCTFCREALSDIAKAKTNIEAFGTQIIFVHMTEYKVAERYFNRYELNGTLHISDPTCQYYAAFGLVKGNFNQLFGLQSWIRGFQAGVANGHGISYKQLGDGFQMPGIFVIQEGEVKESFIHKLSHDRPDYQQLVEKCCKIA
ncbi:MAG: SelL-related redox protein [Bacteroidota bacterium]